MDNAVTTGATYYYVVTAQDTSFNRSSNSNEAAVQAQAQMVAVTFNITVPARHRRDGRAVHIAGSFPPRTRSGTRPRCLLTWVDATHWTITLNMLDGTQLEYKYALGDWDYVEKGAVLRGNRQPHS